MAARSLALAALSLLAFAGAAAAFGGVSAPELVADLPVEAPAPGPAPSGMPVPVVDAPPGGGSGPPTPGAPDLATPTGSWDATLLAGGLAGLAALAGLAVWGGTRFRQGDEVLQHELRSRIYAYVQENVGASLKDITDHLGLSTTNAVWHLRKLEEGGLVRGRKFNGAKVYYPTSGGVVARNLSIAGAAITNANARDILAFIVEHPGVHQREIARLLGVNHGTVRWHLKKLRRAELLEERRSGSSASYHATALGTEALRVVAARAQAAPAPSPAATSQAGEPARPATGQA